jgi:hypothetical protein
MRRAPGRFFSPGQAQKMPGCDCRPGSFANGGNHCCADDPAGTQLLPAELCVEHQVNSRRRVLYTLQGFVRAVLIAVFVLSVGPGYAEEQTPETHDPVTQESAGELPGDREPAAAIEYAGTHIFALGAPRGQCSAQIRAAQTMQELAVIDPALLRNREAYQFESRHGLVTVMIAGRSLLTLGPDDAAAGEKPEQAAERFVNAAAAAVSLPAENAGQTEQLVDRLLLGTVPLVLNLALFFRRIPAPAVFVVLLSLVFRRLYAFAESLGKKDALAISFARCV